MFYHTLWEYWKKFGKVLGKIQTTLILSIIYYLVVTPIGIGKQVFKKRGKKNSYWVDIKEEEQTLEKAQEQY